MPQNRLLLVTGASGALGREYLDHFSQLDGVACFGTTRGNESPGGGHTYLTNVDLLDAPSTTDRLFTLARRRFDEVMVIHAVGNFAFEEDGVVHCDDDGDGIDDCVFHSNVTTFNNIVAALPVARRLTLCAFGSVSDKYHVLQWQSYTRAKNRLRGVIRNMVARSRGSVRGVFINVSTTETGKECLLRPLADRRFWLKPSEIVHASVPHILGSEPWAEIDVYREDNPIDPLMHYSEDAVLARWRQEMGTPKRSAHLPRARLSMFHAADRVHSRSAGWNKSS